MPQVEISLWESKHTPEAVPAVSAPGQLTVGLSTDVDSDIATRLNYALSRGMWDYAAFLMSLQLRRDTQAIMHAIGNVGQQIEILGNQSFTLFQAVNTSLVNLQAEQKRLNEVQFGLLDAQLKQAARVDEQFTIMADDLSHQANSITNLAEQNSQILKFLKRSAYKPKIQFIKITGATDMGVKILFEATWAPITDPQNDTQSLELSVSVDGGTPVVTTYGRDVVKAENLEAAADSTVLLSLVAIDPSGNRSDADTYTFLASDTVPPPTPAGLGVTITGQRVDPD